jgi:hypothetical protein
MVSGSESLYRSSNSPDRSDFVVRDRMYNENISSAPARAIIPWDLVEAVGFMSSLCLCAIGECALHHLRGGDLTRSNFMICGCAL